MKTETWKHSIIWEKKKSLLMLYVLFYSEIIKLVIATHRISGLISCV